MPRGPVPTSVPITVRCECGVETPAMAGDVVTCTCGRRYDTRELQSQQLAVARSLRARATATARLGMGVAGLVGLGAFLVAGYAAALVAVVVAVVVWLGVAQPLLRKRAAARIGALPGGGLTPRR
jgi:hypothetical protein